LREECRLRLFENRVLRRIFGPKRDQVTGEWRRLHKEEFNDVYLSPDEKGTYHIWARKEAHTGFWWGNLRAQGYLEDPGIDGRLILKWIIRKWDGVAYTGLICFRIGIGGGHL
jgi:hypothetical protein